MIDQVINYKNFVSNLPEPQLSKNSLTVLEKRYLRRDENDKVIETPKELFARVAWHISSPEEEYGGLLARLDFANRVYNKISKGNFMFNTPTLFNAGTGNGLGLSACFVICPEDSLLSIAQVCMDLMLIQKSGGGVGYDFSALRPKGSLVKSCSATTDGPIPFIDLYCAATNAIQQGAKRRGAQMGLLDIAHPDIWRFTQAKADMSKWQNMNVSPKVTDEWMEKVINEPTAHHQVKHPKWGHGFLVRHADGSVGPEKLDYAMKPGETHVTVGELFDEICKRAWTTGEPGLTFWDKVQKDTVFKDGYNPIAGLNPCVSGDTLLLTSSGFRAIESLVDQPVRVWNGFEWTNVTPRITGYQKELIRVSFSDGSHLDCTPNHRFSIEGVEDLVELSTLQVGDKLSKFSLPIMEGIKSLDPKEAYTRGVFSGDGSVDTARGVRSIWLYGDKRKLIDHLDVKRVNECAGDRVCVVLESKNWLKSFVPDTQYTVESRLSWLAGVLDTDGSYNGSGSVSISSIDRDFLYQVKLMLATLGVPSTLALMKEATTKSMPDGKGGNKDYLCKDCYRITISGYHTSRLMDMGLSLKRLQIPQKIDRSSSRYITISGLTSLGVVDKVYCFTDPVRGRGLFNCVSTGQCGEQPLEDGGNCTLASINLGKYYCPRNSDGIDWKGLCEDVMLMQHALDNVVSVNEFPVEKITRQNLKTRRIGGGVMGLADLLFQLKIPYDSQKARDLSETIMRKIAEWSLQKSEELGKQRGSFLDHKHSIYTKPMRNAYRNTVAPTGTIAIIAGCWSSIEPLFSLALVRKVLQDANGEYTIMREVNPHFQKAIESFFDGFDDDYFAFGHTRLDAINKVIDYAAEHGTIRGLSDWFTDTSKWEDIVALFQTANDVSIEGHVLMQAAWQEHVDTGISKTINIGNNSTVEDVKKAYIMAYETGCKGITVYRDGSRNNVEGMAQPMQLEKKEDQKTDMALEILLKANGNPKVTPIKFEELVEGENFDNLFITQESIHTKVVNPEPFVTISAEGELTVAPKIVNQLTDIVKDRLVEDEAFKDLKWEMPKANTIQPPAALPTPENHGNNGTFEPLEVSKALKVKQVTPMGNLHVMAVFSGEKPVEIFAQISKAGEQPAADLEAICRMTSLYLRDGGCFDEAIKQLEHIGSSSLMPSKDGQIKSLPDGLALGLKKIRKEMKKQAECQKIDTFSFLANEPDLYLAGIPGEIMRSKSLSDDEKIEAVGKLFVRELIPKSDKVKEDGLTTGINAASPGKSWPFQGDSKYMVQPTPKMHQKSDKLAVQYKLTCPLCGARLASQEGCQKCTDPICGYSRC